ncbi:MAG TPA: FAD-binding and (Fe-S)-binding domain-containing protein [Bacteroidales bacterium]|nr:FAD-binding and (Fe-S)-binding domain-containing protein [Bacteroidales bacterium]
MKSKNFFSGILPPDRIKTDYLHRLAWGTDASFYRKIPRLVLFPETEEEVSEILDICNKKHIAVTFRAAGTSLSGQSLSDSVLMVAATRWDKYQVHDGGETISLQPGIIGDRVNEILKPYGRKFSPDPASLSSAMVGGIMANNASGMNCGTHANSDRIVRSMRLVLADGTILDTGNKASRDSFSCTHARFLTELMQIREKVMGKPALVKHIRYKYSIKNVTGLNLLPLVEFEDPFEMITHLIVGSEGTLAFFSRVTVSTEPLWPVRASSMTYFTSIEEACRAVQALKELPVIGTELLDRKALRSIEGRRGIPDYIKDFPDGTTALLIETAAHDKKELDNKILTITRGLERFEKLRPVNFTDKKEEYSVLWNMRSGIFPSIGGMRPPGSTCLIEDVAFHLEDLPRAVAELQEILTRHEYHDSAIYGHALEGNFHFILNQSFDTPQEVARYQALMQDVITMVTDKYHGSLKAEHGTGRNMAPFVEKEWGKEAFSVMRQIKELFDPKNILNPGVIFNEDPLCHIKDFKPLPVVHPVVDKCIECGFCEVHCLTWGKTLSSRQRIIVQREIRRLKETGENPGLLKQLDKDYFYPGRATCAGDGLCATSCPMEINTGELTHYLREQAHPRGSRDEVLGMLSAHHFQGLKNIMRIVLRLAHTAHIVLGTRLMSWICKVANKMGFPLWTPAMPGAHRVKPHHQESEADTVVYFPSCINQSMGVARGAPDNTPLTDKMVNLLQKAGYRVVFPDHMDRLCCGTIWESKGMPHIADEKTAELNGALWIASHAGKYPVLCDQSPCLYRMREKIKNLDLYEPVEFIEKFLVPRLDFHSTDEPVALHITCTTRKMHLDNEMRRLAERCSTQVLIPAEVGCCGFAGDKGFTRPEINAYALRKLRPQLEAAGIRTGYSNSRTCEIGLMTNGGIPYMSLVYLVDSCTTPKKPVK